MSEPRAEDTQPIVAACSTLLAGHHRLVQGAALADLVSIWLAGHRDPEHRQAEFKRWCEVMWALVPFNEDIVSKMMEANSENPTASGREP